LLHLIVSRSLRSLAKKSLLFMLRHFKPLHLHLILRN